MTIMMMMDWFGGMNDRQKAFSFISSRDFYSDSANLSESILQIYQQISDTPQARFEPALNESSGFVE